MVWGQILDPNVCRDIVRKVSSSAFYQCQNNRVVLLSNDVIKIFKGLKQQCQRQFLALPRLDDKALPYGRRGRGRRCIYNRDHDYQKCLLCVGWRNLFSSCAVVPVFCSGGKQVLVVHTTKYLEFHTVVVLCQFLLVLVGNSFWCYVRTQCTIQLRGCVIFVVVAGRFLEVHGITSYKNCNQSEFSYVTQ